MKRNRRWRVSVRYPTGVSKNHAVQIWIAAGHSTSRAAGHPNEESAAAGHLTKYSGIYLKPLVVPRNRELKNTFPRLTNAFRNYIYRALRFESMTLLVLRWSLKRQKMLSNPWKRRVQKCIRKRMRKRLNSVLRSLMSCGSPVQLDEVTQMI